jgi:acetoin utilization protein AcuB
MQVRSRMTTHVITATPDTTLAAALGLARQHRIRHLPVVEDGRLVGVVTDRDLRLALPPVWATQHDELMTALNERFVGDVMTADVVTVPPATPMEEAARLLCAHRIGCLPVLEDGRLVGMLTETDVMRSFAELLGAGAGASRVEVRMPNRPGELARVVRLVGIEHRINISGMVVPPVAEDECVAILHLQVGDPEAIVHALRRIGYRVGTPSIETDPAADEPPADAGSARRPLRGAVLAHL